MTYEKLLRELGWKYSIKLIFLKNGEFKTHTYSDTSPEGCTELALGFRYFDIINTRDWARKKGTEATKEQEVEFRLKFL